MYDAVVLAINCVFGHGRFNGSLRMYGIYTCKAMSKNIVKWRFVTHTYVPNHKVCGSFHGHARFNGSLSTAFPRVK
jgi:hypothetical protein